MRSLLQNCEVVFIFSLESDVHYAFQYLLSINAIGTWTESFFNNKTWYHTCYFHHLLDCINAWPLRFSISISVRGFSQSLPPKAAFGAFPFTLALLP